MSRADPNCHPLVYLAVDPADPGGDYHWYRKDSKPFYIFWRGHRWSHKRGQSPVEEKDARQKYIYDPVAANKDYSDRGQNNYQNCGYLCANNSSKSGIRVSGGWR